MNKQSLNFNHIYATDQRKLDHLDVGNPGAILAFLEDVNRQKLFNSITKAPLISVNGNSKLKLNHELYFFIIKNYVEKIFLPSLTNEIRANMYLFAFGRLFSKYNDIGVQTCTDFDFNIILDDPVIQEKTVILKNLRTMQEALWHKFKIEAEINDDFTVMSFTDLKNRIGVKDDKSLKYLLFYKSIEDNYYVFNDNRKIREYIDTSTKKIPDLFLFEQYLGFLSSNKNSFFRIKRGDPMEIIPDNEDTPRTVHNVIGSQTFRRRLKVGNLLTLNSVPEEWYFSMKYMVNRVYDYVCAMRAKGYSLKDIGCEDHDYQYIRNANLIMLIFQELKFERLATERFGVHHSHYDFSYISGKRIHFFSSINPISFNTAIKSIIYDLKIVFRYEDILKIEAYIKKKKYNNALWFYFCLVEFWISRKVAKLLNSPVLEEMKKLNTYSDYMNILNLPG